MVYHEITIKVKGSMLSFVVNKLEVCREKTAGIKIEAHNVNEMLVVSD